MSDSSGPSPTPNLQKYLQPARHETCVLCCRAPLQACQLLGLGLEPLRASSAVLLGRQLLEGGPLHMCRVFSGPQRALLPGIGRVCSS